MPPRINLPPLTRALIVVELCLSLIAGALRYSAWVSRAASSGSSAAPVAALPSSELLAATRIQYLTVVPALSIVYPWTLATAAFVEANIFTLVVTSATFFYGGKYLERAWGSGEFAKFLGVVAVGSNVVGLVVYVVWYAVSGNVERNFTSISGGAAFQAGFLVAFKQLVPEHTVTLFKGLIRMRVKHFPALFVLFNILSGVILGTDVATVLATAGFFISWTYLRFYKKQYVDLSASQPASLRGDASETFAFAHFFPDSLYPVVAPVANAVYGACVALRICTPFSDDDIQAGNNRAAQQQQYVGVGGGGGLAGVLGPPGGRISAARQEAERRRALALKVLDQRLHAATTTGGRPGGEMLGGTSFTPEEDRETSPGKNGGSGGSGSGGGASGAGGQS